MITADTSKSSWSDNFILEILTFYGSNETESFWIKTLLGRFRSESSFRWKTSRQTSNETLQNSALNFILFTLKLKSKFIKNEWSKFQVFLVKKLHRNTFLLSLSQFHFSLQPLTQIGLISRPTLFVWFQAFNWLKFNFLCSFIASGISK